MQESQTTSPSPNKLKELAALFFKLGCISFGGPAAHIAMMEDEVVRKRQWMSREHFLDLVGATNLIPGPNSTEMTMHCGHERAGWPGLVVAGVSFIFPAIVLTAVFAWMYSIYGTLPAVSPFIAGIKPAVLSVVVVAVYRLGQKAFKSRELGVLAVLAFLACVLGLNEIIAMFAAGMIGMAWFSWRRRSSKLGVFAPMFLLQVPLKSMSGASIFWSFFKVGALLYGSGYVLFAFLDAELVSKGLMSRQQLMDAIAVGQFTPGPVLSTATFVGWQLGGWEGALLASIGIFLPSFLFVALLNPLIPRLRKSPIMSAFLDAVNVAAVAVIAAVALNMAQESITDWRSALVAGLSFMSLLYFKQLNSAFVVIGGALAGYLLFLI